MGKHDITAAEPMNQALERHYKDRIKELEMKLSKAQADLNEANATADRLRFNIETDRQKIDELEDSLIEMTILATARKKA